MSNISELLLKKLDNLRHTRIGMHLISIYKSNEYPRSENLKVDENIPLDNSFVNAIGKLIIDFDKLFIEVYTDNDTEIDSLYATTSNISEMDKLIEQIPIPISKPHLVSIGFIESIQEWQD